MLIVNKSENKIEFGDLVCGAVFRDRFSNYCMKIEYDGKSNMVYLADGTTTLLSDEEEVTKVRCELVVEN